MMGKRSTYNEPKIYKISKFAIFNNIFKNYIMGIGVYQGMEFMLQSTPFDIFKKMGLGKLKDIMDDQHVIVDVRGMFRSEVANKGTIYTTL